MFWTQENGTNKNNSGYRLIYAEFETDIQNLPTQTTKGTQLKGNSSDNNVLAYGSECIVLETGNVYVLKKSTNTWDKFGGR